MGVIANNALISECVRKVAANFGPFRCGSGIFRQPGYP